LKRLRRDDHMISMTFPEIQIGDCCVLKLLRRRVEGNILSVLRMKFPFKYISGVGRGLDSLGDTPFYYSTNCNTIRYPSSVGNRYPAIYVASYVGRKSEAKNCRQKDFKKLQAVLLSIC